MDLLAFFAGKSVAATPLSLKDILQFVGFLGTLISAIWFLSQKITKIEAQVDKFTDLFKQQFALFNDMIHRVETLQATNAEKTDRVLDLVHKQEKEAQSTFKQIESQLKADIALTQRNSNDISDIRNTLSKTTDRVTRLETLAEHRGGSK